MLRSEGGIVICEKKIKMYSFFIKFKIIMITKNVQKNSGI